ncbi:MAG: DUF2666 family protein, partial [Candidatus Bilamarchaeaceae archaeon]
MPEELIFEMDYKGERRGVRFNLESASEEDVAHAISRILPFVNEQAFRFSGIDRKPIEEFVNSLSAPTASEALKSTPISVMRAALDSAVRGNPLLFPAAEAYFYFLLLKKYSLSQFPSEEMFRGKPSMDAVQPRARIALIAKFGNWVAIKKMSIVPGVQDYEVSAILCAISETLARKAFDFARLDLAALESHAKRLAGERRKSPQNVG